MGSFPASEAFPSWDGRSREPGCMADKKAKTAEKGAEGGRKLACPACGAESRVVEFTGYGPRGFFWVCEKNCGYTKRTR
jgi:hypothetical protein